MSDSQGSGGEPVAESPLDRLRRLARESSASKAGPGPEPVPPAPAEPVARIQSPAPAEPVEPVFEEPVYDDPVFEEPVFEEPRFDEPVAAPIEAAFPDPGLVAPAPTPDIGVAEPQVADVEVAEPAPANLDVAEVEVAEQRPTPPRAARRRRRAVETPVAVHVEGTDADDAEPVAPLEDTGPAPQRLKVLTGALAALVVLAAVGLFLSVRHERDSAKAADDRAAATAAAIKTVSDITTLDYRNLDDWLRRVQADSSDGSTPGKGLKSEYASTESELASVTAGAKSVSKGGVVKSVYCGGYCATSQVAGGTASALVYGTAQVTSSAQPAGVSKIDRFTVKLIKVNGQWLATNVDDVGVAATS